MSFEAPDAAARNADAPKPKSILKNKPTKPRASLVWDEKNLAQNEDEKVPRMKINEPNTPYRRGSTQEDADALLEHMPALGPSAAGASGDVHFSTDKLSTAAGVTTVPAAAADGWDTDSGDDMGDDGGGLTVAQQREKEEKRRQFELHRKAHYKIGRGGGGAGGGGGEGAALAGGRGGAASATAAPRRGISALAGAPVSDDESDSEPTASATAAPAPAPSAAPVNALSLFPKSYQSEQSQRQQQPQQQQRPPQNAAPPTTTGVSQATATAPAVRPPPNAAPTSMDI